MTEENSPGENISKTLSGVVVLDKVSLEILKVRCMLVVKKDRENPR
jgi:hypothetical protein